ncbi:MAG: FHA domain-containing protein [bacterium JZ-2024 1]
MARWMEFPEPAILVHFRRVAGLFLVALTAVTARAGSTEYRIRIDQIDYSGYPEMRVYFTALNPLNLPLVGLTTENVLLKEDGIAVSAYRVSSADTIGEPLRVALLIDESGSMKQQGAMDAVKAALTGFLEDLDPAAQVRLSAFGDRVHVISDWETPRAEAISRVNSLSASATRTLLFDGLADVMTVLKAEERGRRAIIVMTDGRDEGSKLTADDVARSAQDLGVPLFALGFGSSADMDTLERLARLSGGWAVRAQTPKDLASFYEFVQTYLMSTLVLVYETRAKPGAEKHAIALEFKRGGVTYSAVREFVLPLGLKPTRATRVRESEAGTGGREKPPAGAIILSVVTLIVVVGALFAVTRSSRVVRCEKCGNPIPKGATDCPSCEKAEKEQKEQGVAAVQMPTALSEGVSRTLVFRKVQQAVGVLRVISGSHSGKEYLLELPRVVVGRGRACDILLDDASLAAEHFVIRKEDGQYIISDLGSEKGTLVNGQKITEKTVLNNGARIQAGDVVLVFRIAETVKSVV